MPECRECTYFRKAKPPDPLAGWRVLSSKIFELRTKWEKHLDERAMWEQQRFEASLPFDFEPLAYAYCGKFSKPHDTQPSYSLCAQLNPDNNCSSFQPKASAKGTS